MRQYGIMIESIKRGVAQFGRALRSGRRGRKFKSCFPDSVSCLLGQLFSFCYNETQKL